MTCPDCLERLRSEPHLVGACASVGIERGMTTRQALAAYLAAYHESGHRRG